MTSEIESNESADVSEPSEQIPTGDQPAKNRRPGRRTGRVDGEERRPRRSERQLYAGWGDGIERCRCEALAPFSAASGYPVHHRAELTIAQPLVVDLRDDALLYCTLEHDGAHVWPDGEVVADPLSFLPSPDSQPTQDVIRNDVAPAPAPIADYDIDTEIDVDESESLVEFLR